MSESDKAVADTDLRRKLVVCCDGTWNKPFEDGGPTNVVKMVRAIRPVDNDSVSQLIYYHPGVGTGNWLDRLMGGTLGIGLSANVQSAYDFVASNYVDGDLIFLFGFSRGAFTARSLAGLIGLIGLLDKKDMDLFPHIYDIYRLGKYRQVLSIKTKNEMRAARGDKFARRMSAKDFERMLDALLLRARPAPIFFIGVWDTVGSLGIPYGPLRWVGRSMYSFHNTDLSDQVCYAYQALAIDESRRNFKPTLWTRAAGRGADKTKRPQTLEQLWFAGVHSNVGGGYPDFALSDVAFLWMVAKAAGAAEEENPDSPLAFDDEYLKEKIEKTMGLLVNSRTGFWKLLPGYQRPVLATPPSGKETCESIHYSVRARYDATKETFSPFPYKPDNVAAALKRQGAVATLMALEQKYRPWP